MLTASRGVTATEKGSNRMSKYSKTRFKLHFLKGIDMETQSSPFIRFSIGAAILILSISVFLKVIAPEGIF